MKRLLLLTGLLIPSLAMAAGLDEYFACGGYFLGCDFVGLGPSGPDGSATQLALMVVGNVLALAEIVAFVAIIYGAILLIINRGELEKGKNALMYAIAGFVLIRLTGALITFVVEFFDQV